MRSVCRLLTIAIAITALTFVVTNPAHAQMTRTGASDPGPAPEAAVPESDLLDEGFEDITNLPGWILQNNSEPIGATDWLQGSTAFNAHAGSPDSYIGANFQNADDVGTISNWLVTPEFDLSTVGKFSFYTRGTDADGAFPDRLEVRLCDSGDCTDVGTGANDVGNFSTVLFTINENLDPDGYPAEWTLVELQNDGWSGTGRFAMRYFVTNSGPNGSNGDLIGIDTVQIESGTGSVPATSTTGLIVLVALMLGVSAAYMVRRGVRSH